MKILCVPVGELQSNSYIVYDEKTSDAAVFDCGGEAKKLADKISGLGLNLKYIILTHGHFDHIMAANELKEFFPESQIGICKDEEKFLSDSSLNLGSFIPGGFSAPNADFTFCDEEIISVGSYDFSVIKTTGHTSGSCCFLCDDILISGDTLFKQSIGRCDFPTGNMAEIENSIVNILYKLDDNIKVYPGHGEMTTIGYEKKNNCFFRI